MHWKDINPLFHVRHIADFGQHIGVGAFQQEQRDAAAGAEALAGALEKIAEKLPV